MLAACGPELSKRFFKLLTALRAPVVDLWAWQDPAAAAGESVAGPGKRAPSPASGPQEIHAAVLVVGGGVGGSEAALDLARAGLRCISWTNLCPSAGTMAKLDKTFPTLDCSICILGPKLVEVATHPNIELLTYAQLNRISGEPGNFQVEVTLKPRYVDMNQLRGLRQLRRSLPGDCRQPVESGDETPQVHQGHLCPGRAAAGHH